MAELTRQKRAESGQEAVAARVRGADSADARSGRLAASRELRGLGLDAVSEALAGGLDGPVAAETEAPGEQAATRGAMRAGRGGGEGAETSPLPAEEMQKEVDRVVREANEDDAKRQAEGGGEGGEGGEGGAPGAGGGASPAAPAAPASAGLQAPAAAALSSGPAAAGVARASAAPTTTSARAAAPQPTAKSHAIIVQGRSIGDGEAIPGSFQASSGFGAAMARSGHAMGCIHCMAGTNSWAKPGGFPGTLGLTTVRNAFVGPKFEIEAVERDKVTGPPSVGGFIDYVLGTGAKEWVATVKPTSATDATHPCVSSPAGEHKTGTTMINVKGVPTAYDTFLEITPAYAAKIWAAEDEHLADAQRAYDISLQKAADEVNRLAAPGLKWVADTKADAEQGPKGALQTAMPAKLGIDPVAWRTAVWNLCLLTISGRDNLGYHTFYTSAAAPDHASKKVVSTLTDGTTQIGSHSSASVVDLSKI